MPKTDQDRVREEEDHRVSREQHDRLRTTWEAAFPESRAYNMILSSIPGSLFLARLGPTLEGRGSTRCHAVLALTWKVRSWLLSNDGPSHNMSQLIGEVQAEVCHCIAGKDFVAKAKSAEKASLKHPLFQYPVFCHMRLIHLEWQKIHGTTAWNVSLKPGDCQITMERFLGAGPTPWDALLTISRVMLAWLHLDGDANYYRAMDKRFHEIRRLVTQAYVEAMVVTETVKEEHMVTETAKEEHKENPTSTSAPPKDVPATAMQPRFGKSPFYIDERGRAFDADGQPCDDSGKLLPPVESPREEPALEAGGWKMAVGHDEEGKPILKLNASWALNIEQYVAAIGKDKAALLVKQLDKIAAPKEPEKTDAQVELLKAQQARIEELEAQLKAIKAHQEGGRVHEDHDSAKGSPQNEARAARALVRQAFYASEKEEPEESASLPDDLCDALQPMLAALSKAMDEGLGETTDVVVEVSKQRTFLQVGRQSVASTTGPRDALVRLLENISRSLRTPAIQEKLIARAEQGHAAAVQHLGTLLQKMLDASAEASS